MKNEYYGVQRSGESIAHYGIKGMKWGVQKAKEKGNSKKLDRQYRKAEKKLSRLEKKADLDTQKSIAKKYGKVAKISGGIGAAAAINSVGAHHLQKLNWKKHDNEIDDLYNAVYPVSKGANPYEATKIIDTATGKSRWSLMDDRVRENFIFGDETAPWSDLARNTYRHHSDINRGLNDTKGISGIIGAAGLGVGALAGARALAAKRHTTTGGHAAAVAKRDEFKKEMGKAFKGTKYANRIGKSSYSYTKKVKHDDLEDPNSLAHYGIKGMKWGVQKAKEKGNSKKLDKHYAKANKKLMKLSDKADRDLQFKRSDRLNKAAKTAAGMGVFGVGAVPVHGMFTNSAASYKRASRGATVSGLVGIGSLGAAAGLKAASLKAGYNATSSGHAKAVAKRDAWKKEMGIAFKNTKYDQNMTNRKVKHDDLEDPNSLAHYGIKGMKWGVRKAIENGSSHALSRHFKKAAKKLAKLENKANRQHQENIVKAAKRDQKYALGYGAASTGVAAGKTISSLHNAAQMAQKTGFGYGNIYLPVGAGIAAGAIAGNAIRKARARKNLTTEGHAKAQAKANEFRREMNKAFKGTEYAKQIDSEVKRRASKAQNRVAKYAGPSALSGSTVSRNKKKRG